MATISTTIKIQDGYSRAFSSLLNGMNHIVSSFEAMDRASGHAVNTASIRAARQELNQAGAAFNGVEQQIREATEQQNKFNESVRKGSDGAGALWNKVKGLAAAYVGIQTVGKAFSISDQMTSTEARLNLIVDDNGSVDTLKRKILLSANDARSGYQETAAFVAKVGANAGDAFANNDEMIGFANQIQKKFVIAGAGTEEMNSATLQLTQALGSGVLRGEELNAVFESAPNIIQSIADYMDKPIGKIRELAQDGELSADVVKQAIFADVDETNKKFDSMPKTWAQIWTIMQNNALVAFEPVLKKINQLGNNEGFQQLAAGVLNVVPVIANVVLGVFDLLGSMAGFVSKYWSILSPIIWGVVAALGAYYAILGVVKVMEWATAAATGAMTIASNIKMAAMWLASDATFAATAAQWGFNAALFACPIFWIVIGFIMLIAIIFAVVAAWNYFTGESVSALGVIAGALSVFVAVVSNQFIAVANFGIDCFGAIWNYIALFVNFLGNVFTDPLGSIVRLFRDFADVVLSIIQGLASAIDTVFGSNLASSVKGWRNDLGDMVDKNFGKGEEIMAKFDSSQYHVERIDYGEAYDFGYKLGDKAQTSIGDFVGNIFGGDDMSKTDDALQKQMDDALKNANKLNSAGNKDAKKTAKNTDKMSKATEEDLKYLRDIAEREVINRFTTAEIRVEMNNSNSINSEMDLDGIVSKLTDKVEEQMYISAEGIHT